jgi:hypothetical protein
MCCTHASDPEQGRNLVRDDRYLRTHLNEPGLLAWAAGISLYVLLDPGRPSDITTLAAGHGLNCSIGESKAGAAQTVEVSCFEIPRMGCNLEVLCYDLKKAAMAHG